MITLKTRYRDIPWEDVMKVHKSHPEDRPAVWETMRGRSVEICLPAYTERRGDEACDEPHYLILNEYGTAVCCHLAIIGD